MVLLGFALELCRKVLLNIVILIFTPSKIHTFIVVKITIGSGIPNLTHSLEATTNYCVKSEARLNAHDPFLLTTTFTCKVVFCPFRRPPRLYCVKF